MKALTIGMATLALFATPVLADWTTSVTAPQCIGEPTVQLLDNPSDTEIATSFESLRECKLYAVTWAITNSIELDPCDNHTECSGWAEEKCTKLCCVDEECSQGGTANVFTLSFAENEACDSECRCGDGSEQEINAFCYTSEE